MLLKYYDITVSENDIPHDYIGQIKTAINSYIAPPHGYHTYILYTKPNYNDMISPYDNDPIPGSPCFFYDRIVNELSNGNPIISQIAVSSTTYLPYTTDGHYIVIKGIFNITIDNSVITYCLINDSYATYSGTGNNKTLNKDRSGEYVVPYTELLSYIKQHTHGWSIVEE